MITTDKLDAVRTTIDKLVAQGTSLYDDIAETATDRARLLTEAEEREQTIDRLNRELLEARDRITDLEGRNTRLVDDLMKLESELVDANKRLENIRREATESTPQRNGNGKHVDTLAGLRNAFPPVERRERSDRGMRPMPAPTLPAGDG